MEKAKMESRGDETGQLVTIHELGRQDHEFFSKARPIGKGGNHFDDDDSGFFFEDELLIEGAPGIVPKLTVAEEQALCDKFNATLAEYDSDEFGEGCDDDDLFGDRPLEGDAQVEAALDDFLQEKKDEIFIKGTRHYMDGNRNGGSSFAALVGKKMIPARDIEFGNKTGSPGIRPISDILGEADETLSTPHHAPPAEEIFIDGKSYFSERIRNPWDCESILSTYSNLDNNPVTIGGRGRRGRKKNKKRGGGDVASMATDQQEQIQQILLSDKTGLPLGVLPTAKNVDDHDEIDDTYMSLNKGEARCRNETAEEKRLRKLNVKKERQLARMQKKMMKEAYNDEFGKRHDQILVDDVGGKSVFRF
jgi:protein LTV1